MNCSNAKCSFQFMEFSGVTCSHCPLKFCSDNCLNNHTKISKSQNKIPKKPFAVSTYLKRGEMLNKFNEQPTPYYAFNNFDYVKTIDNSIKLIGKGTYSEVLLVKNSLDGHHYAIKRINKEKMLSAKLSLNAVYQEIAIHRKIVNENVIKVFNVTEDSTYVDVLMEYADYGDLRDWFDKKGNVAGEGIKERKGFDLFIQIASVIAFLHQNGLSYSNLDMKNILLCNNGSDDKEGRLIVKLFDFSKCTKMTCQDQSLPNDIVFLGMILYEFLHGYSTNSNEYSENKVKDDISEECKDLLMKLLDNKIKAIDIFNHSWVKSYEKQSIMQNRNRALSSSSTNSDPKFNKEVNTLSQRYQSNNAINKLLYPWYDNDIFNYDVYDNTIMKAKEETKARSKSKPKIRTEVKIKMNKNYEKLHRSNNNVLSSLSQHNDFVQDIRPIPKGHDSSIEFEYGRKYSKQRRPSKKFELEDALVENAKTTNETAIPSPFPVSSYKTEEITSKKLYQALELLEHKSVFKTQKKRSYDDNDNDNEQDKGPYQNKDNKNESFWDKLFINFKCCTPIPDN